METRAVLLRHYMQNLGVSRVRNVIQGNALCITRCEKGTNFSGNRRVPWQQSDTQSISKGHGCHGQLYICMYVYIYSGYSVGNLSKQIIVKVLNDSFIIYIVLLNQLMNDSLLQWGIVNSYHQDVYALELQLKIRYCCEGAGDFVSSDQSC